MTHTAESKLFQPVTVGAWKLRNRIAMAPLTRCRAIRETLAPQPMNAVYYGQRATAGLIISEATQICPEGQGYFDTPGIYSDAQVAGWREVTKTVHAKNGTMLCQLWHVGRISHPSMQPGGGLPVAPSAIKPKGKAFTPNDGLQEMPTPRALETSELPGIVGQYVHAAKKAREAGFDGIEIHGANGYLLDQFMRDSANHRSDAYGGSIENRARLTLEVVDALVPVWGKDRTGIRLSPVSPANDISDSNPQALFGYVVEQLNKRGIAYIHMIEGSTGRERNLDGFDFVAARKAFGGAYIANNGYDRDLAIKAVDEGRADMVAFGKPYIANPDLAARLEQNAPLNKPDSKLFYGGGEHGYTDYPRLND
jgi:N-ethylmaleimide reductase